MTSAPPPSIRTVFLDRDGVLNAKLPEGCYVRTLEEFRLLDGVAESIARLNRAGVRVMVVSNQRGVSLGKMSREDVETIHAALQQMLSAHGARIDRIYFCPHARDACRCRKPLPGMFEQARADFPEIDAARSVMIGDALCDIEFGHHLGMRTVFLNAPAAPDGHPAQRTPNCVAAAQLADLRYGSLPEAVDALLSETSGFPVI